MGKEEFKALYKELFKATMADCIKSGELKIEVVDRDADGGRYQKFLEISVDGKELYSEFIR